MPHWVAVGCDGSRASARVRTGSASGSSVDACGDEEWEVVMDGGSDEDE